LRSTIHNYSKSTSFLRTSGERLGEDNNSW
jgi:hypothetical protein